MNNPTIFTINETFLELGIAGDELLVYALIRSITGPAGQRVCRLPIKEFSRWLGKSDKTARTALRSLHYHNLIEIVPVPGELSIIKIVPQHGKNC